jgi:hypothetical protein
MQGNASHTSLTSHSQLLVGSHQMNGNDMKRETKQFGPGSDYTLASGLFGSRLRFDDANDAGQPLHLQIHWIGGEKMKIDLTERESPSDTEQPGVIADVVQVVKADKRNKHYNVLVLVGQLAATKSNGKRFIAHVSFNLENSRGINRLKETLKVWRGSDTLPDLGDFDPEKEFLGKGFLAKPVAEDKGGKRIIRLAGLKPSTGEPIAVSPDFVRAAPQAAATP